MGEWREVAARADGAPTRDGRHDAALEEPEQQLYDLRTRARAALRQRVRAQEHRPPRRPAPAWLQAPPAKPPTRGRKTGAAPASLGGKRGPLHDTLPGRA